MERVQYCVICDINQKVRYMKWKNKGHELDAFGDILMDASNKYYIWGAGTFGMAFYEKFHNELNIVGFIDSDKKKIGVEFCGMPTLSPNQFKNQRNNEIVLVSTGRTREVYEILDMCGFHRSKDYFHIDETASVLMYRKYNKVYLNDVTIQITRKCTLNCEYCNVFIPLMKNREDFPIAFLQDEIKTLFQWADYVNVLGLTGGDAMAHSQIEDIIQWIGEQYYPDKINHMELYCNAIIIPNESLIQLMKKYHVVYRFTDYSISTDKQKIQEVISILQREHILYDHAILRQWADSGYPQESNGIKNEENLIAFFDKCDRKTCHSVWKNNFFCCSMCVAPDEIGYCELLPTDYFELEPYVESRRAEFIEYYLGYNEKGYFNYCKKCNGGLNVNKKYIVSGQQKKF